MALLLPLAGPLGAPAALAARQYAIDPRHGSIEFSVGHLGLFTSHGRFRQFGADLTIDPTHPEQTRIDVTVDAASVDMPWQDAADLLRSAEFFDVARYPDVRFHSTSVTVTAADRYAVGGLLEMHGVIRPVTLTARLTGRQDDAGGQPLSADFVVSGQLSRAAFGMVNEQGFVSDAVGITIHVRIALGGAG